MKKIKKREKSGLLFVATAAALYLLTGALLLAVPKLQVIYLCYAGCGFLIAAGIIMIVHYFLAEAYRNLNQYGFSVGAFIVVIGMCGLVKSEEVAANVIPFLGIALLFTATIKLQNALDVKRLSGKLWPYLLAEAFLFFALAAFIIIQPIQNQTIIRNIAGAALVADGVLGVLSYILLAATLHKYEKGKQDQKTDGQRKEKEEHGREEERDSREIEPKEAPEKQKTEEPRNTGQATAGLNKEPRNTGQEAAGLNKEPRNAGQATAGLNKEPRNTGQEAAGLSREYRNAGQEKTGLSEEDTGQNRKENE